MVWDMTLLSCKSQWLTGWENHFSPSLETGSLIFIQLSIIWPHLTDSGICNPKICLTRYTRQGGCTTKTRAQKKKNFNIVICISWVIKTVIIWYSQLVAGYGVMPMTFWKAFTPKALKRLRPLIFLSSFFGGRLHGLSMRNDCKSTWGPYRGQKAHGEFPWLFSVDKKGNREEN